ncbi:MAG: RNA polymerase sigma factor [Ruminococcus sp.]|nr:RNA polymerase sigma factor [Ruminococcus sp.]
MTDNEFDFKMKLILEKNKNGLRDIYNAYGRLIYHQMLAVVKSPQDAEDLTSDFFLRLWETAGQYRSGTGHKRYITVMARNMAVDFLRKRRRESYTLDDEDVYHEEPADTVLTDETVIGNVTFEKALELLNAEEREIINLRLGFELTFKEISKTLGKPLGTVTWKYRQAVSKLRKTVKEGSING